MSLDSYEEKTNLTVATKNENNIAPSVIPFSQLIPYRSAYENSKEHPFYPFWNDIKKPNANAIRYHIFFTTIVGLLTIFATVSQILFIIYAPSPYKIISLVILIVAQIVTIGVHCVQGIWLPDMFHMHESVQCIIFSISCVLLLPFYPIFFAATYAILIKQDIILTKEIDYQHLLFLRSLSTINAAFQNIPQLILLTLIMGIDNNIEFDNIFYLSYISSCLCAIVFALCITEVFANITAFIFNTIWLWFDLTVIIFIILTAYYNETTVTIFYVDLISFGIMVPSVWISLVINAVQKIDWKHNIINELSDTVNCNHADDILYFCVVIVSGIICLPCGLFMFAILCLLSILFIIPFIFYLYVFSMFWFSVMDQINGWNIFPMCFRLKQKDEQRWFFYLVFEWIKNGYTSEEQNDRLCCVNMVILDTEPELKNKYQDFCHEVFKNVGKLKSNKFTAESVGHLSTNITAFYNFGINYGDLDEVLGHNIFIKFVLVYYPINRLMHWIIPFILMIYIAQDVEWNITAIDMSVKISFCVLLISFIMGIVCSIITWNKLYFHRLILPMKTDYNVTVYNYYTGYNDQSQKISDMKAYTANCHYYLTVLKIIVNWSESQGGGRDVATIIMDYFGVEIIAEDDRQKEKKSCYYRGGFYNYQ